MFPVAEVVAVAALVLRSFMDMMATGTIGKGHMGIVRVV